MTYVSTNLLSDFEFHDARFEFVSYKDNKLIVSAQYLNIHKGTEQNMHTTDMEIEIAQITFDDFSVKTFEPGRAWKKNEKGEFYTDEPQIIFQGSDAEERMISELRHGIIVYSLDFDGSYYLEGFGYEPYFIVCFNFRSATVEWDSYNKAAWYEERPFNRNKQGDSV